MWKKIHSNRDPRDTLWKELRKEFSGWFNMGELALKSAFQRSPKLFFRCMVFSLLLSVVCFFALPRRHEQARPVRSKTPINPVGDGFNQILQATGQIRESLQLKQLVDSISAKKTMSATDSALLDSALNKLQQMKPFH